MRPMSVFATIATPILLLCCFLTLGAERPAIVHHHHDASDIVSGTLSDDRLSNNVTRQGNTFNGSGELVQLDASGSLPALDGSNLTGVPGAIPRGGIIMWSGSIEEIPDGWALCDGANGTPDLRDRFVVGARQDQNGVAMTNIKGALLQTGGESSHALTVAEMPSHNHPGTPSIEGHAADGHDYDAQKVRPGGLSGNTGGNQPHENCPPFFSLAFIMRK